jgi:rubrerythrin
MERSSEHDRLAVALAELRPTPEAEFAVELDALVAAGFPRRSRLGRRLPAALGERLRVLSPRRLAYAGGAVAVVAIVVATALISSTDSGNPAQMATNRGDGGGLLNEFSGPAPESARPEGASAAEAQTAFPSSGRAIERSAQITLLASPENVASDSAEVFAAVHDAHGIVLSSNTTQGPAGRAGAHFDLLIPSAKLGDALAALSAIDEVGSRHDATADITAPTIAVGKRLHETRTSIENLLSQLASAETEAEREALEIELRRERNHAAAFQSQLDHLHRRTRYYHLSVSIETGDSSTSPGGAWGIDDALGSAGHVLAVAAGVTIVGLAVLAPLLALILLAWLAYRTWLRIRREQALSRRV